MKDLNKFQSGMTRLFDDHKTIAAQIEKYDMLFNKNREIILSEAGGITEARKRNVFNILKKLYDEYRLEIDGAVNVLYAVTDRQDRALTLARKLGGAR